jgi:hypothetical protein
MVDNICKNEIEKQRLRSRLKIYIYLYLGFQSSSKIAIAEGGVLASL